MAEWWQSVPSTSFASHPFEPSYQGPFLPPQAQAPPGWFPPTMPPPPPPAPMPSGSNSAPKVDSPRETRNKAEKLRRDTLNQSIAQLASMLPPVVQSTKKVDKIGVLRYTAHYLRVHQYVFDKPPEPYNFSGAAAQAIMSLLKGFLLTTTYKGLIVVLSQNIKDYLGHIELELLGRSVFNLIHKEDQELFRQQLLPRSQTMGQHGELVVPTDPVARQRMEDTLASEKRQFLVRFLKVGNRNEPSRYVTCHVEGSFRISDRAKSGHNRCLVRRTRARGENPCNSGNDVVFVCVVRLCTETFINESALEFFRLEYRTRHTIDGEIIQCEQRICLVTGYMMEEVSGINAMNFIHRDEVRWVIIALKDMYNKNQLYGESCYRLMTKTGQFIYMRTRGRLDVDPSSRFVTSFICTNTVVDEKEGKELIAMMKERYKVQAQNEDIAANESSDSQAVEDPRQLEKVILNMVTSLPHPEENTGLDDGSNRGDAPATRFCLIANKRERIVSAIEKIYTVFKTIPGSERSGSTEPRTSPEEYHHEETSEVFPATEDPDLTPVYWPMLTPGNNYHSLFGMSYQAGGEYNSDYSPLAFSDIDSAADATAGSQEEMRLNEYWGADQALVQLAFEIYTAQDLTPDPPTPNTSTNTSPSIAGVKRPNRFEDEENTSKKKVNVATEETGEGAGVFESMLDDATLNAHIQSVIETLEVETLELNLPEFLSSSEVENILEEINNEDSSPQPNEDDL